MTLPHFLCIGAMKSATTTLFEDLCLHPGVYRPAVKEPGLLADPAILTPDGLARYRRLFAGAGAGQLCFECSTRYTKRDLYPAVPARARELLGADLKLLYLVRDPLARALSHHFDYVCRGWCGPDVNVEMRRNPEFLDTSRYAHQLHPWLAAFGAAQIRVFRFDHYIADRRAVLREISGFLGLVPHVDGIQAATVYNRGTDQRVLRPLAERLAGSDWYRRGLRRLIPPAVRAALRRGSSTPAPTHLPRPTAATLDYMLEKLRADVAELPTLPGCAHLTFDLPAARQKILAGADR